MQKISRGRGFAGVLSYVFEGEDRTPGHGRIIGGNMAGTDKNTLAREFRAVANLRPDIEKPVWHSSLRMPKNEDVSDEKWQLIAIDYMHDMGWDLRKTQFALFKHDDEHVHLIANRVQLDSTVYLGQNENLRNTRVIGQLEKAHGLTITKGPDVDEDGKLVMPATKKPGKSEVEKALREGERPARVVLQELVTEALRGKPDTATFLQRLDVAGVEALPNVASTGRMNGFSFRYQGLKFSGSELGAAFKWSALQKEIDYEQTRDGAELARRRDAERSRAEDDGLAGPVAGSAEGPAAVPVTAGEGLGTGGGDRALGSGLAGDPEPVEVDRSASAGGGEHLAEGQEQQDPDAGRAGHAGPAAPRLHLVQASERVHEAARPAVQKDVKAKVDAWHMQCMALDAPTYRLTLVDRVKRDGRDRTHNYGKGKEGAPETFYTPKQVEDLIPTLRGLNARGFDVYITPIDPAAHHILVDDVRPAALAKLKADGFTPCLVQASSANNLQAVIRVPRVQRKDEQSIANALVVDLNKAYGDPELSGVIHPFRMAGFSNKKEGKRNAFTRVLEAVGAFCDKATSLLATLRSKIDSEAANRVAEASRADRIARIQKPVARTGYNALFEYQAQARWLLKNNPNPDWSRIDFGVACEMLKKGHAPDDVEAALREGSPALADRKHDVEGYLARTMEAAQRMAGQPAPEVGLKGPTI